jgi:TonB family protein
VGIIYELNVFHENNSAAILDLLRQGMETSMRIYFVLLASILFLSCNLIAQQQVVSSPAQVSLLNWWKDPALIQELQLSESQTADIDKAVGEYRRKYSEITVEYAGRQKSLIQLLKDDPLNEEAITKQIELVGESSSALVKAASSTHLLIRKNLTKEQWIKINSKSMPLLGRAYTPNPIGMANSAGMDSLNGVVTPKAINRPLPSYTKEARANRIQGVILLQVIVHKDGTATVAKILKGLGYGLDQQAIDTVNKSWRFEPGTKNGAPVEVMAEVEVVFRLY